MDPPPEGDLPDVVVPGFEPAWEQLDRARVALDRLRDSWQQVGATHGFESFLETGEDGSGRVGVSVTWPPGALEAANDAAHEFATAIKATFDAALTAAARAASGYEFAELSMPLFVEKIEFDRWVTNTVKSLLRPDQVGAVAKFQPFFGADAPDDDAYHVIHVAVTQLVSMLKPDRGDRPRVTIWVHSANPAVELADGARVRCEPSGDGPLRDQLVVGTFAPPATPAVEGNPDCAFDPILDDEPYPTDGDDTLNLRSQMLVAVAGEFIRSLQRSATEGYYDGLPTWLDRRSVHDHDNTWAPLDPGDENAAEIHELFETQDVIVAAYYDPDGNVSMLLRSGGTIFARPLTDPFPLRAHAEYERGSAVEDASLGAAALWGLPDFVMRGKVQAKGNSTREVGDGTIITGGPRAHYPSQGPGRRHQRPRARTAVGQQGDPPRCQPGTRDRPLTEGSTNGAGEPSRPPRRL